MSTENETPENQTSQVEENLERPHDTNLQLTSSLHNDTTLQVYDTPTKQDNTIQHETQPISSEDTATPVANADSQELTEENSHQITAPHSDSSNHNTVATPHEQSVSLPQDEPASIDSQPATIQVEQKDTSTPQELNEENSQQITSPQEQSSPDDSSKSNEEGIQATDKPKAIHHQRLEEIGKRSLLTQSDDILERRSKDDSSLEDRPSNNSENADGTDAALNRRSGMRRTSTISGSLPSREEMAPKTESKWKTYRREFRELTSSGTVIGTRKPSMVDLTASNNNNNNTTPKTPVKQQPSGRMIELKVDALVGGVHGVVSKQFSSNMTIAEVVKSILKRFPQTDEKYVIYLPMENPDDEESDGMCLDENKKLGDYDDQFLRSVFELKRLSEVSGPKKSKKGTLRATRKIRGPNPKAFLADPSSKILVNEMPSDSIELTFMYNQASSAGQWSKPDKEGEVFKQGYYLKSIWSNRWVILQNKQVFCFKTKPTSENDTPTTTISLEGGWYGPGETTHIKSQRVYSFEVFEIENNSKKKFCFAANTKQECEEWMNAIRNSIHSISVTFDPNPVQSQSNMTISISYGNLTGYIGLPSEWKQALRSCGITERYFYSFPDKALKMLRSHYNTNSIEDNSESAPIVVHPLPESKESFLEDVINRSDNPELIYTNFQLIGSGTFGEVYLATNVRSNQVVAIKKMLLTPKREPLFISEISVQKHSEHPNVLKLFEAYKVEDHLWVALEYMEHGNLYELLAGMEMARRCFTEPQVAYLVTETLKALSYIHGMHRIHRDIKSDNILIGANAEIKLADFGYAVQLATEEEKRGTICGSPFWMAPEIILGQKYGKTVDIWSLGILLLECCDLQPPYITEAPSKALILISTQPPPSLNQPDRWSKDLKHFLSLCLQRDADLRPQAIELLRHPFLLKTCSAREFKEQVLDKRPPRPQQQ